MELVRQIYAAPMKLALNICGFFPKVDKLRLVEAIWKTGREPEYACRYIALIATKRGIEAAEQTADEIFKEYPSDQVAGTIGVLEFRQYNLSRAKEWLEKGKQCPERNPESLLNLELELADHLDEYDVEAVVAKILSRRDLAMSFTTKTLMVKAELFLRAKRWDDAEAVSERVSTVEEMPWIWWIKWIIAKARGDEIEAEKQLRLASAKVHKAVLNIYLALGWYYLEDIGKTREFLAELQREGVTKDMISRINPKLGELFVLEDPGLKKVEEN